MNTNFSRFFLASLLIFNFSCSPIFAMDSIKRAFSSFINIFKTEPALDENGVPNKKIRDEAYKEFLKSDDESFNKNGRKYSKELYDYFGSELLDKYEPKNKYNKYGYDKDGYKKDGYDFLGFDRNHIHKDTGTHLSPLGFDVYGYNPSKGIICAELMRFIHDPPYSNPEIFGKDGYNCFGFDRNGIHRVTGTRLNEHGFNRLGVRPSDTFDAYTHKYHNQDRLDPYNSMPAVAIYFP